MVTMKGMPQQALVSASATRPLYSGFQRSSQEVGGVLIFCVFQASTVPVKRNWT
jgi:hypothetical protein